MDKDKLELLKHDLAYKYSYGLTQYYNAFADAFDLLMPALFDVHNKCVDETFNGRIPDYDKILETSLTELLNTKP